MRVLIAAGIYPPEIGGPATYAKAMMDALPGRGFDISVLPQRDARRFFPFHHIAYCYMLFASAKNTDVVFAQHSISVGLAALVVSKIRGTHFVMRVGGDYAWEQGVQRYGVEENLDEFVSGKSKHGFMVRIFQLLQSFIARRAEAIIVPSAYLKRIVLTWGADVSRIHVVYSAFIPETITDERDALRAGFGFRMPTIVSAARLVRWKGMDSLVSFIAELRREYKDIFLVIIGDGPERKRLEHLVETLNLDECVRFTGDIPHMEVLKYCKAADVFVLNTGYEGLSYTLLEAMAQGVPVVSTSVGGNPELIETGRDGVLVQYDNAVELSAAVHGILSGSINGAQLARAARERASQFSENRMINGTIEVLKSL